MADTPQAAFPAVKAVQAPPKRPRKGKPNPATEPVKAAFGKGWQAIPVTDETVEKLRSQITRAASDLGYKGKTRTDNPSKPTALYFEITERAAK